jgi:stress response protein YsnF
MITFLTMPVGLFSISFRKRVLISSRFFKCLDYSMPAIHLSITKEQVEKSPDVDTHQSGSRQMKMNSRDVYRWPYYVTGSSAWGRYTYPAAMLEQPYLHSSEPYDCQKAIHENAGESQLRSIREVQGYEISGYAHVFGKVEGFIIDDESWDIRYLVINTDELWDKSVLISPQWVSSVRCSDRLVQVNLNEEQIKNSPEYTLHLDITHEYEEELHNHYSRPNYWAESDSRFSGRAVKRRSVV